MKTGLLTFYHIHHYGAMLQAYATERAVASLGSECEIIDYYVNQDNTLFQRPTGLGSAAHDAHTALHYGPLKARYERFEAFSRENLNISGRRYQSLGELRQAELPYDVLLSGSDQIWNPKIFPDAVQIAELNYLDTIELAYSGAQIIHPKTIKPLQNKNIPLYVRPFGDKRKPGTVIRGMSAPVDVPILILKKDQVLLTIRSRDFSFVLEEKFATIFSLLERFRVKTNLIHNSAVNLSLCVDNSWHIDEAVGALREAGFDVMKAERMELLTVRGYTPELWRRYAVGPQVFVRQATQATVRIVRKRE